MPQPTAPGPKIRALTSLVLTSVVATACGGNGADASPGDAAYGPTVSALCQALSAEDRGTAAVAFWSGAHASLHDLASEVVQVDRAEANDLLLAKNAVESLLREQAPTDEVREGIDRLLASTQDAVRALERTPATC
ncbi:MAG TPA: hypothetical protein VGA69_11140 [Nitriliruptorales bacterium]